MEEWQPRGHLALNQELKDEVPVHIQIQNKDHSMIPHHWTITFYGPNAQQHDR